MYRARDNKLTEVISALQTSVSEQEEGNVGEWTITEVCIRVCINNCMQDISCILNAGA